MPFGREKKVLDFVNSVRHEQRLEPLDSVLPGEVCNAERCPIANSIALGGPPVEVLPVPGFVLLLSGDVILMPREVCEWARAFDCGRIPEMIAPC